MTLRSTSMCSHCELDSAGNHAIGCPVSPSNHESAVRPRQGWECPRCHAVYAPWVIQCKGCKPYRPESWVGGS